MQDDTNNWVSLLSWIFNNPEKAALFLAMFAGVWQYIREFRRNARGETERETLMDTLLDENRELRKELREERRRNSNNGKDPISGRNTNVSTTNKKLSE